MLSNTPEGLSGEICCNPVDSSTWAESLHKWDELDEEMRQMYRDAAITSNEAGYNVLLNDNMHAILDAEADGMPTLLDEEIEI